MAPQHKESNTEYGATLPCQFGNALHLHRSGAPERYLPAHRTTKKHQFLINHY